MHQEWEQVAAIIHNTCYDISAWPFFKLSKIHVTDVPAGSAGHGLEKQHLSVGGNTLTSVYTTSKDNKLSFETRFYVTRETLLSTMEKSSKSLYPGGLNHWISFSMILLQELYSALVETVFEWMCVFACAYVCVCVCVGVCVCVYTNRWDPLRRRREESGSACCVWFREQRCADGREHDQAPDTRRCPAGGSLPGVIHTNALGAGERKSARGCMLGDKGLDIKGKKTHWNICPAVGMLQRTHTTHTITCTNPGCCTVSLCRNIYISKPFKR